MQPINCDVHLSVRDDARATRTSGEATGARVGANEGPREDHTYLPRLVDRLISGHLCQKYEHEVRYH